MTTPDSPDCEILPDETGDTCAGFYARAHAFFAAHGIDIQAVTCDNAFAPTKAVTFRQTLAGLGVKHVRIRPRRPQTNGKVERFNRTLLKDGSTSGPTGPTTPAPERSTGCSTPTITTDPTHHSAADHPCHASTTLRITPRSNRCARAGVHACICISERLEQSRDLLTMRNGAPAPSTLSFGGVAP